MRLPEICEFLHVQANEVMDLMRKERLPGQKIAGEWRFRRDEVFHWLGDRHFRDISEARWRQIELGRARQLARDPSESLISLLIPQGGIALDMPAKTRASVLRELVSLAESTGLVYDAEGIHEALAARERLSSTAIGGGVALPHPHEPLPYAVEESMIVVGRTACPVPFGAPDGGLTDLFFLAVCVDREMHLHATARLSRMILSHDLAGRLREAETPDEARETISAIECEMASLLTR
ncbi:MAG TPA: PTS sugar transporter subunit IIA [Candidatus Brocadiia bacterium]|nr:PTS sugar transporter subunit IIA [Candidatus Brocadiia bacterium]